MAGITQVPLLAALYPRPPLFLFEASITCMYAYAAESIFSNLERLPQETGKQPIRQDAAAHLSLTNSPTRLDSRGWGVAIGEWRFIGFVGSERGENGVDWEAGYFRLPETYPCPSRWGRSGNVGNNAAKKPRETPCFSLGGLGFLLSLKLRCPHSLALAFDAMERPPLHCGGDLNATASLPTFGKPIIKPTGGPGGQGQCIWRPGPSPRPRTARRDTW
ncbi:hypothetical protein B0T16DRAFT_422672 [Cercophora newfieldiana]|uniref:Uncharacterized protein n=1 Tax=Cercophora newfieldiana TaxID=92897 RepID=A0AA39XTN8_9PEZI|nr:hypothetical protein B0T16DRAFT_422672 [Cercophora newfieldiana]